ncbi:ABC transporter ATP-binding protein [Lysinibacillus sp. Ag94]|uniref:ABC transporter ATP-binding protein n=1 Tax=Lysinibacillus sp. Ag94 TaxID=2936682 RepID=UPI00200E8C76|nr:ABC transporter ATP-binding protein [Lysinibacillus sp. Ag94]UPW84190.1 ABC transporter ATP-binding protein [Lysinibacillus sp. Ag94]
MKIIYDIKNVTKKYPSRNITANQDINLEIYEGEIIALLGPNGAGKSTLIKQMMGLIKSTSGSIHLFGEDIQANSKFITENVSYYAQDPHAITSLRVWESVYFSSRLKGLNKASATKEADRLIEQIGLEKNKNDYIKNLSGGQKRLISVALTLTGNPKVLIFDEPTNELDPVKRKKVWEIITDKNKEGATIILVTHNVLEAEQVVDRVAIINEGKIVALDGIKQLKQRIDQRMRLDLSTNDSLIANKLFTSFSEKGPQRITDHKLRLLIRKDEIVSIVKKLANLNEKLDFDFSLVPPTLEDVYLRFEGGEKISESIGI